MTTRGTNCCNTLSARAALQMRMCSYHREIVSSTRQDGNNNRTTLIRRMYRKLRTRPVSSSLAIHDNSPSRPEPRRLTTVIMLATARERGVTVQDPAETTKDPGTTLKSQHLEVNTADRSLYHTYQNHSFFLFVYLIIECAFFVFIFGSLRVVIRVYVICGSRILVDNRLLQHERYINVRNFIE